MATNASAMMAPGRSERQGDAEGAVEALPDEPVTAEREQQRHPTHHGRQDHRQR